MLAQNEQLSDFGLSFRVYVGSQTLGPPVVRNEAIRHLSSVGATVLLSYACSLVSLTVDYIISLYFVSVDLDVVLRLHRRHIPYLGTHWKALLHGGVLPYR